VWQHVQGAPSQEEHELGSITLRLLGLIREGLPATLDLAAFEAFGCSFNVWRQRNLGRKAAMAWELAALIPDYDPSVESRSRLRRPAEGKGSLYPLPEQAGSPLKKPVLPLSLPRTGTK
jgi:hypothetical protein